MKSMTKRTGAILVSAALATTLAAAGAALLFRNDANAVAEENVGLTYYYSKFGEDVNAKNFYDTFKKLNDNGAFKTGKLQYNLIENSVVTKNEVQAYVNSGDTRIPKAFTFGRDSFYMDNPDLFYVDLFGTSVSAGSLGGDYAAFLDSSNVISLYVGGLNTEEKVNAAITEYNNKVNEIVAEAKKAGGVIEQIKYVNAYMCENVEYSFGVEVDETTHKNVDTPAAAYIYTSYGALINNKAVCEGYAKGFKAVMDRLGIPCVCVQGTSLNSSGESNGHMWNAVQIEGLWYNVDVTWNCTGGKSEKWLFLGSQNFKGSHFEDNVVSSSGNALISPAINPYDYGVDDDDNGMYISGEYKDSSDGTGKLLNLNVSYEGKGGEKLHEEGKYLAFRFGNAENGEIDWGKYWFSAVEANEVYAPFWTFEDTKSTIYVFSNIQYVQLALMSKAPEDNGQGADINYAYVTENLKPEDFLVVPSEPYENEGHSSYVPAPWGNPYPSNGGDLPVNATYDIRITYTESLEKIDPLKDVKMTFTASSGNDVAQENAVISDFQWDGDKVVTFKFTPSQMYINNLADYYFVPDNVQGVKSKKIPEPVRYCFKGKSVVCSKFFNDGRLYMSVFGEPKILDTSDVSVTDFKDENGNYYAESQRSQLLLVVNRPDENKSAEMNNVLLDETPLKEKDIVSSETYEIDLQICGMVRTVPNGSYMQVAFGFPEGYSADDAGTTFKIYHYKHDDNGNITGVEEIPAIITKYGIIAKVQSFSPFTVVQIKTSSAAAKDSGKSVYASAIGNGSVRTESGEGGISTLNGKSITYNIKADEGYQVSFVRLNGKAVEASRYAEGKLTLESGELESGNMLEVGFVSQESAKAYAEMGFERAVIETSDLILDIKPAKSNNTVWIVLGCIFGVIIAGCAVSTGVILYRKKKLTK